MILPHPNLTPHFLLRSGITFLNHGSFGACPAPVFATYQQWQRELEAQPVAFLGRQLPALLAEVRTTLGTYLGVAGDDLALVPNATHGVNSVARSLDLQPGDEVLGTDHEYGAVNRTWQFICARAGAIYRQATLPMPLEDSARVIEALWQQVTPRTRMIVVSHITSPTALILPVAAICARARAEGILTLVDGAHAPGQIALDLTDIGADFYTGNCHKWLCAPKGAAFLYARPALQDQLEPLIVSWGWQPEQPGPSRFVDLFGWTGTADPAAYLSIPAAIAFQAEHDWPALRTACHDLLAEARQAVGDLAGQGQLCTDAPTWYAQMATIPLPPCDPIRLKQRLWDDYAIEVPVIDWNGRPHVRISIQVYNGPADLEHLLIALRALL
ncbi:MAG: aminotransferase class V-fold PLP-dependent enzyme [Oscillochloridaceae bacterium umkhey_bin13]